MSNTKDLVSPHFQTWCRESKIQTYHLTNCHPFFMHLSCYWSWISSQHCQSNRSLWQCYDEIHCLEQDRCVKNWCPFVFHDSRPSNCLLLLVATLHKLWIHVSVPLMMIKISQQAHKNLCCYCKKYFWQILRCLEMKSNTVSVWYIFSTETKTKEKNREIKAQKSMVINTWCPSTVTAMISFV